MKSYFDARNSKKIQLLPLYNSNNDEEVGFIEPPSDTSQFGRQAYWNEFYNETESFSWYAEWSDLEPFVAEFMQPSAHILIPGVGNDATLVDMYDAGYHYLTAMDYAADGIERCKELLGEQRLASPHIMDAHPKVESLQKTMRRRQKGVCLVVADARNLTDAFVLDLGEEEDANVEVTASPFDAVLEKGTLDAIYLSGGSNKTTCMQYLEMAITELCGTIRPGGAPGGRSQPRRRGGHPRERRRGTAW